MQAAALRERELPFEYLAADVLPRQLGDLKQAGPAAGLGGFNVTAPLKIEAASLCDDLTPTARQVGAVNTVRVVEDKWLGHNTDCGGIGAVISQAWTGESPPAVGHVLGGGGSARAAVMALRDRSVPLIRVRNRSAEGRQRLADWLGGSGLHLSRSRVEILPLADESGADPPDEPAVWIACLPGEVDLAPLLPDSAGSQECLLVDLRYSGQLPSYPVPLGFQHVTGEPVLLLQGGLSFAWWFGPPVPWDAMRNALTD